MKVTFVGDIMLSRQVGMSELWSKENIITKPLKKKLTSSPLVVGNLECPIAENALLVKPNGFKANPKLLSHIESVEILSLANNHIFDCGIKGAKETIKALSLRGKAFFGLKLGNCNHYVVKEVRGKTFSFVGAVSQYCQSEISREYLLTLGSDYLKETVRKCREKSDYVVCYVHGGNEFSQFPEPSFRADCKKLITEGADLVVTNHPHIFGGNETFKGKHIFYSLGDFIFDGESNLRSTNIILSYHFNSSSYEVDFAKIIENLQVSLTRDEERKKLKRRFLFNSTVYELNFYPMVYKLLYLYSFLNFQLDRIFFLIGKEGLGKTFIKTISRLKYLPVLFKRFIFYK
jgi:poly-gamma-glutamate capsule biosynthesis protein CapA/YwtB (metallophosphatase superfamily)